MEDVDIQYLDYIICGIVFVILACRRVILRHIFLSNVARDDNYKDTLKRMKELSKQIDFLFHYVMSTIVGFLVVYPIYMSFRDEYFDIYTDKLEFDLGIVKPFYIYQIIFYVHELAWLIVAGREEDNDYVAMLIHHSVSITLLVSTFRTEFILSGMCVLFLHDSVDALLSLTLIGVNAKVDMIATPAFLLFALTFFATRIVLIPYELIRKEINLGTQTWYEIYLHICLWVLTAIQVYWFLTVIIKVLIDTIRGESVRDIRDDKIELKDVKKQL